MGSWREAGRMRMRLTKTEPGVAVRAIRPIEWLDASGGWITLALVEEAGLIPCVALDAAALGTDEEGAGEEADGRADEGGGDDEEFDGDVHDVGFGFCWRRISDPCQRRGGA